MKCVRRAWARLRSWILKIRALVPPTWRQRMRGRGLVGAVVVVEAEGDIFGVGSSGGS